LKIFDIGRDENGLMLRVVKKYPDDVLPGIEFYMSSLEAIFKARTLGIEKSWVAAMDRNNNLIGVMETAIGETTSVDINIKTSITFCLMVNACSFYHIHNHPGHSEAQPSAEDVCTDIGLKQAANAVGLTYRGGIIIAHDEWCLPTDDKELRQIKWDLDELEEREENERKI
jgi:hypothetical protein